MVVFINDKKVRFKTRGASIDLAGFQKVVFGTMPLDKGVLKGHVAIIDASQANIHLFIKLIEEEKLKKLQSVTFFMENKNRAKAYFKKYFKQIKAGGGIVEKGNKILLIYRNNKWDIPKGKLESGELIEACSQREVEEETAVIVKRRELITKTYHTYLKKDRRVLKKNYWYRMECVDDSAMKPQLDEGITDIKWMTKEESLEAVQDSFASIKQLLKKYYKL